MGSLSLLQGIFPTQGSNLGLPHCRWILYQLSHKGSPFKVIGIILRHIANYMSMVCVWGGAASMCMLSHFQLFATPWTIVLQAPLSMEFSSQEYWSGLPFHPLGDLPDVGIEPVSLVSPVLARRFFTIVHLTKLY